jgi:hypothetical protein
MLLPDVSSLRLMKGGHAAPADDHIGHAPVCEHEDAATGRVFAVSVATRETEGGMTKRFFLAEFVPTGQIVAADGQTIDSQEISDLDAAVRPNEFIGVAEGAGISREQIVMVALGAEGGAGFDRIDDALDTIMACLAMNRRYNQFVPLEDREALRLAAGRRDDQSGEDLMPDLRAWAERA